MKKVISILVLVLLTGCTCDYNLQINNNSFKENINIYVDNSKIADESNSKKEHTEAESEDQLKTFIDNKISSLVSEEKYYKKRIIKKRDITNINLKYKYNEKNFSDAYLLNNCFESFDFTDEEIYEISAYGSFYCLYTDSFALKIKTSNKVVAQNADEIDKDVYIWNIDEENKDKINIYFKVDKGISYKTVTTYIFFGIVIIGIIVGILIFYAKSKKRNVL